MSPPVRVVPMAEQHIPFVFDYWLESFRLAHAAGPIPMDLYWPVYREVIKRLIDKPTVDVLGAYNPDDGDQFYGFLVRQRRSPPIVHYLYVKKPFRRNGIAKILMTAADIPTGRPFIYTFKTPAGGLIAKHSWLGAAFDPLAARFKPKLTDDR